MSDWRLRDQEEYLHGVAPRLATYTPPSATWDHEHCEFCGETISAYAGDLHRGYTTLDSHFWICEQCFNDFKGSFAWTVVSDAGSAPPESSGDAPEGLPGESP
jgi:hypothetical protein